VKSRFQIYVLIGAVAVLVLFWVLWPRQVQPVRIMQQQPQALPSYQPSRPVSDVPATDSHNPSVGEILAHIDTNKAKARQEAIGKAMESGNVPIDFYGQTVDQNGNPLAGVRIGIMVRHWTASLDGTAVRADRTSDANGFFDIHDITGDGFDLESMNKEGYELEPMRRGFGSSGGAPGNPVIFRLWRNDLKEPLMTGRTALHLIPDGRTYSIDITNGIITDGIQGRGDLALWVKRPEKITRGSRYDWSCDMQVINGGLLEDEDDEAMYFAPTTGYSNSFHFDARNGWGDSTGTRHFYLKIKDGEYGRASIEIMAYYNKQIPGMIRIDYAINPTGSRILR